jgi:hypothetical protein
MRENNTGKLYFFDLQTFIFGKGVTALARGINRLKSCDILILRILGWYAPE